LFIRYEFKPTKSFMFRGTPSWLQIGHTSGSRHETKWYSRCLTLRHHGNGQTSIVAVVPGQSRTWSIMYFVDLQISRCCWDRCWQGQVDAWLIRIRSRDACSFDKQGPSYSIPKVSCSACSAGVIQWKSDSESSEFKEPREQSSSDNSLRSVSDSESIAASVVPSALPGCAATWTGAGAIAWFPLDEEVVVLFPLFPLLSSTWASRAGWYSIALAGDEISIRGI